MILLSLDQGSFKTGYCVIEYINGSSRYITTGTIRTSKKEYIDRMYFISNEIGKIITFYNVDTAVLEEMYIGVNMIAGSTMAKTVGFIISSILQKINNTKAINIMNAASVRKNAFSMINFYLQKVKNLPNYRGKRVHSKEYSIRFTSILLKRKPSEDEADAVIIGIAYIKKVFNNKNNQ